jgi:predicted RNA-binding protein YlqC (UPF0109 family)
VKELIEYIARSLVDDPDQVHVSQIQGAQAVILELTVAPDDMGKVIGKQGRIANAMRTLLKVAAAKYGRHAMLEIVPAQEATN